MANIYGTGTVYQRKDGRWVAKANVEGRMRYAYTASKSEAARKLRDLWTETPQTPTPTATDMQWEESGTRAATCRDDLPAFAERWLASSGIRPTTEATYRSTLTHHVFPVLSGKSLGGVTPSDVAGILAEARRKGLSAKRVRNLYLLVHRLFAVAVAWGLMERNPASAVTPPRVTQGERALWTVEQATAFLAACRDAGGWADFFVLALVGGFRVGELAGLEWRDVEWARGVVAVRRAVSELRGDVLRREGAAFVTSPPKTGAGVRDVALPPDGVAVLRRRWAEGATGRIFVEPSGLPPRRATLCRRLQALCEVAGVPHIGIHGLRHMHVSLLAHAGVPLKAAQQRVGHSTPQVTLNIYTHILGDADARAANALDALLVGTT